MSGQVLLIQVWVLILYSWILRRHLTLCHTVEYIHLLNIHHLRYNLDLMNNWSLKWQLYLNISKCKFISLGNSLNTAYTILILALQKEYNSLKLQKKKILEYGTPQDLKPSMQCHKAVSKAMQALDLILQVYVSRVSIYSIC